MANQVFFVKYNDNQPVKIAAHYDSQRVKREWPLIIVADVIWAVKQTLPSKLGAVDPDELTLHLPPGVPRSALHEDCFVNFVESDTTLRIGMPLSRLDGIGADDTHPLIIKKSSPLNSIDSLQSIKFSKSDWETTSVAVRSYNPADAFFNLDSDYIADSGLTSSTLILYCRSAFRRQFEFLQNRVLDEDVLGWILGPPGIGKSVTALAFISTIPKMVWSVTWIHMSDQGFPMCLQFEADKKKALVLSIKHTIDQRLNAILEGVTKKHLVFVDGYAASREGHLDIIRRCISWRKKDRSLRRLCVISSMHSRRYPSSTTDLLCNIKEHFVESWSLGDYKAAVENKQFYANISHNLDVSNDSDSIQQIPSQLVESKLYFAGGSSRFMFDFNTDDVIEMINVSVSVSTGVMPYLLNAIGDRSEKVINRLCSCVIDQYGKRSTFIVSKYAATSLAMKEGPELIHRISEATWYFENLLIDGWLLEMWFFASLITDGVKIQHRNGSHCEVWPRTSQIRMIDSAYIPYIPEFPAWFRPRKWNKGSYDAIYFDKAQKQVLFVQITHRHMHSFRIEYFYDLLRALSVSRSAFEIAKLDIAFLVDKEKLHDFFISDVSGEGLLSDFPGWRNGYEKENVKLFGIAVGL